MSILKKKQAYWVKELILHYAESVRIRSYSGPYFPAFGLNTDQNNSEYGHFLLYSYRNNKKEMQN